MFVHSVGKLHNLQSIKKQIANISMHYFVQICWNKDETFDPFNNKVSTNIQ